MISNIFGIPIYKSSISQESFNKDLLMRQIEKNFAIDASRNEWDKNETVNSSMHHSYGDDCNSFINPDYTSLIPVYEQKIIDFLNCLPLKNIVRFNFEIINYTCMTNGHMKYHVHPHYDFSAIHYLKFNNEQHKPTVFSNPCNFSEYFESLFSPQLLSALDDSDSWTKDNYCIHTEENDFIIFPSFLKHGVPPMYNVKDHRITIAINIKILS